MIIEFGAGFLDYFIWLDSAVCVDLDLDLLFKRMRFLVAGESDPRVLEELVSDDIAERMIVVLHEDCGSVLLLCVIDAADKIPWTLDGGSVSSGSWPTWLTSCSLEAYSTCKATID